MPPALLAEPEIRSGRPIRAWGRPLGCQSTCRSIWQPTCQAGPL